VTHRTHPTRRRLATRARGCVRASARACVRASSRVCMPGLQARTRQQGRAVCSARRGCGPAACGRSAWRGWTSSCRWSGSTCGPRTRRAGAHCADARTHAHPHARTRTHAHTRGRGAGPIRRRLRAAARPAGSRRQRA
jgi:hypothetical protein